MSVGMPRHLSRRNGEIRQPDASRPTRVPLDQTAESLSGAMSAGLARNWWAIGLRGMAAILFGLVVLLLPSSTVASFVLLFAAYVTADGLLAILAGTRAVGRGERWWTLIVEGMTNLAAATAVLIWAGLAVVPLVGWASGWAVVTGGVMLAAAHRLSTTHGRWLLAFGGGVSAGWGALAIALRTSSDGDLRTIELWLVAYALVFGITLLLLASRLRRRHREPVPEGRSL
jgi:uncharacterized membrane protein HdeD (DUF308 family)